MKTAYRHLLASALGLCFSIHVAHGAAQPGPIGTNDTIMPGHGLPLPKSFLGEQIACVENILDGTCKGEPYKSFAGTSLVCRYKSAAVAFDPNNLRMKK